MQMLLKKKRNKDFLKFLFNNINKTQRSKSSLLNPLRTERLKKSALNFLTINKYLFNQFCELSSDYP